MFVQNLSLWAIILILLFISLQFVPYFVFQKKNEQEELEHNITHDAIFTIKNLFIQRVAEIVI
jgi:hypothetical protein